MKTIEQMDLSFFSAKPKDTERVQSIKEHSYRDKFQRDRDRVLYSKEFRRLSGKTQIFVAGFDDNMRTRLTHTLEVAQIAETIARRLNLNTMLTTAIAYAHDIGHTPFGHIGERTLNYIMNGCFPLYKLNVKMDESEKGFKHNLQGVRVATFLEKIGAGYGLNLTKYTLWGIKAHTSSTYKGCDYYTGGKCSYKNNMKKCLNPSAKSEKESLSLGFYEENLKIDDEPILIDKRDWTLEAIIVAHADEIAQRHHDIEDGIYAGIIDIKKLKGFLSNESGFDINFINRIKRLKIEETDRHIIIRELSKIVVDYYVTEYCKVIYQKVMALNRELNLPAHKKDWKNRMYDKVIQEKNLVEYFNFDDAFLEADKRFSGYLSDHILNSELAQKMDGKAVYIIKQLMKAYLTNPQQLPDKTIMSIIERWESKYGKDSKGKDKLSDTGKRYTDESRARAKLKKLMKENDSGIKTILLRSICDYIAGMTDQYAINCFEKLYGISQ